MRAAILVQRHGPRRHQSAVKPSGGGRPGALVGLLTPTTGRPRSASIRHHLSRPVPCRVPFPFEATTAGCSSCCHSLLLLLRAHCRVFGALQHFWQLLVEEIEIERVNDRNIVGEHLRDGRLADDDMPISCRCGLLRIPSVSSTDTHLPRGCLCVESFVTRKKPKLLVGITSRERCR